MDENHLANLNKNALLRLETLQKSHVFTQNTTNKANRDHSIFAFDLHSSLDELHFTTNILKHATTLGDHLYDRQRDSHYYKPNTAKRVFLHLIITPKRLNGKFSKTPVSSVEEQVRRKLANIKFNRSIHKCTNNYIKISSKLIIWSALIMQWLFLDQLSLNFNKFNAATS